VVRTITKTPNCPHDKIRSKATSMVIMDHHYYYLKELVKLGAFDTMSEAIRYIIQTDMDKDYRKTTLDEVDKRIEQALRNHEEACHEEET